MPAKLVQSLGKLSRVIEDLVNLELLPVVEAAAQDGRLWLWQAMVKGCRSRFVTGIHEKYPTAGGEAGSDKLPKLCEPFGRNVGNPKAKKYDIELFVRLPFEHVRFYIANQR
jgi:hypothetical protein